MCMTAKQYYQYIILDAWMHCISFWINVKSKKKNIIDSVNMVQATMLNTVSANIHNIAFIQSNGKLPLHEIVFQQ